MTDSEKNSIPPVAVQLEDSHSDVPREVSKAEKRLVRKQDLIITTLLSGSYFFAYMVRLFS